MFTPIHLLPQYNSKESAKYEDRWETTEGQDLHKKILSMIRGGAGEDFLQWEFEGGRLVFLESMWDLKGIDLINEKIDFPKGDNFEAIDFSYASFHHCTFKNATFPSTAFNFTRLYNCEFIDCIFAFTVFYATNLEKVRFRHCDFIEHNRLINSDCREVRFEDCFIPDNLFLDCRFDEQSAIERLRERSVWESVILNKTDLAEIYKGIKDAYRAGDVIKQARLYFFKERHALTRYNAKGCRESIEGYFLELITGYGVRPLRVLVTMIIVLLIYSSIFVAKVGISEGLLLSAGAFFTFGANSEYLQTMGTFSRFLYISEAFLGVSLMALYITVLANVWFREK